MISLPGHSEPAISHLFPTLHTIADYSSVILSTGKVFFKGVILEILLELFGL